jgi:dihydrofolate reductase
MRKVVVSEFVSLDGVMEGPGGDNGFIRGPWTLPYWGDELAAFKQAELFAADALLLGRITYEGFSAAWPERGGDPFGDHMNASTKYVVSTTLTEADASWGPVEILAGDLTAEIGARTAQEGNDILVAGSCTLVHGLLAAGLVDELRMAIYPVVLGTGMKMFGDSDRRDFELVEATTTSTGVQLVTLRKTDAPPEMEFDYEAMTEKG